MFELETKDVTMTKKGATSNEITIVSWCTVVYSVQSMSNTSIERENLLTIDLVINFLNGVKK